MMLFDRLRAKVAGKQGAPGWKPSQILSGSYRGLNRIELVNLHFLSRGDGSAIFGAGRHDGVWNRLDRLARLDPPLVKRGRHFWPGQRLYAITEAGRAVVKAFGEHPSFAWVNVPGVTGVDPDEVAQANDFARRTAGLA